MATSRVTGAVVDSHVGDSETLTTVNADSLDGGVLNVEIGDAGGTGQVVGVEELGLGLAAVGSLAVPPAGPLGVQLGAAGTLDSDILALDLQERTVPLLVTPGGLTLEDDLEIDER